MNEQRERPSVLLITNNPDEKGRLITYLEGQQNGHHIDVATPGEDAITHLRDNAYPVVLLGEGSADFVRQNTFEEAQSLLILPDPGTNDWGLLELFISREITRAEKMQQDKRYRALVEHQLDLVVQFDTALKIQLDNAAYRACQTQQTPTETDALAIVHDEDRDKLQKKIKGLTLQEPTFTEDVRTARPDESPTWHRWRITARFDAEGVPLQYDAVIRDITEEKKAERERNARLEELDVLRRVDAELTETLNINSVVILALDTAMRLSGADIAAMGLFDDNTQKLSLRQVYGVPTHIDLETVFAEEQGVIRQVIKDQKALFIEDIDSHPDATAILPAMTAQMVIPLISQERFVGLIILETRLQNRFTEEVFNLIQLITTRIAVALDNARLYNLRRQQLEELRSLYEQVTQLEQLKTDMIRLASHDLRNPIGALQGAIEILKLDINDGLLKPDEIVDKLDKMNKMIKRMRKITEDILSVERIERQNADPDTDPFDLMYVIQRVVEEFEAEAAQKNITYNVMLSDGSIFLMGDNAQIREASANLISNAIKYTPNGGQVEVSLEYDGSVAIFEVNDNGYGIPEEYQSRLFEPFYRAVSSATRDIEGTGLGLHLVKSIVERHGGHVIFRSQEGVGSTFGFQIPIEPQDT